MTDCLWFVALDTLRLRAALHGARLVAVQEAVYAASRATGVEVVDACALPTGVRLIARTPSRKALRSLVRRLTALSAAKITWRDVRWRPLVQARRLEPHAVQSCRDYITRCRSTVLGDAKMPARLKHNSKSALRRAAGMLRVIERSNETMLGADETAARVRRYVAAHDAPHDDRAAFGRLCAVIFAQGLGFEALEKHRAALQAAFYEFSPAAVAQIDEARVGALLHEPIIRNRAKIEACVENARRWNELASAQGTYLGRMAQLASGDDAAAGWPQLAAVVQRDFRRLRELAARLTLKRWGFFTAIAHPGSQRVLTRLGLLQVGADGPAVQRFVGALAQATGRDPYAVEAALAIFAGVGPCRVQAQCSDCALSESCPTGTQSASGSAAAAADVAAL